MLLFSIIIIFMFEKYTFSVLWIGVYDLFVWLPQVLASAAATAAASMRIVVVRFADADADADAYYIATANFIGVSCRTRRQTQLSASTKRTRIDAEC